VGDRAKGAFLGKAAALLFPIDWPEPFGLVMIEAMACGTPVIAMRRGSVPEIIEDGVTGFVVDSEEEALAAIGRLGSIDRRRVRAEFERRFTARRMAQDYLRAYQSLYQRQLSIEYVQIASATEARPVLTSSVHQKNGRAQHGV
jgi:glycosyltransferase involved in cell wall biosynthesis